MVHEALRLHQLPERIEGMVGQMTMKRLRLRVGPLAAFALIGLVAGLAFRSSGWDSNADGRKQPLTTRGEPFAFAIQPTHPLLAGRRVQADLALRSASSCSGCLGLPASGLGSRQSIKDAYVDDAGGVGFVLADETWVVLTPDDRSSGQYVRDMAPILESDNWPFSLVELRGGRAIGTDVNSHGPAALMWVEGGYLWEVIGKGGSSLATITGIAERLDA
jgi:hypothetical protein